MKNLIPLLLLFWSLATTLMAIPADPTPRKVTQPDGTTVSIVLRGDEHFYFHTTTDGMPVVQAANGAFYFATLKDGRLEASNLLARDADQRTTADIAFVESNRTFTTAALSNMWQERVSTRAQLTQSLRPRLAPGMHRAPGTTSVNTGKRRGLIILVEFKDNAFQAKHSKAEYTDMANLEGYNRNKHIGSVHDYFYDASYGQFDLEFDVVGPIKLKYNMSYYGEDSYTGSIDMHVGEMIAEAIQGAVGQVDFSQYDWDNNGEVDQVYVLYAGYGQAGGASSSTVWPHEFYLQYSSYGKKLYAGGKYFNQYSCGNELYGNSGTQLAGIGTLCHEYSHCLGLPDFYDTAGSNFGMAKWSVMDGGVYNNYTCVPCPYTAYERYLSGWLEPTELDGPTMVKDMRPITEHPDAYIIYNDGNRNEYFMLENHQKTGWDAYAGGHGMLVTHIDYDRSIWAQNVINNTASRQRMTIIPADNAYDQTTPGFAGDPFPGTKGKTSLTDDTTPAARVYNKNTTTGNYYMGKPITNITEKNGLISFSFMGAAVPNAPTSLTAEAVTENGFTAKWDAASSATFYNLQLRPMETADVSESLLISEDFGKITVTTDGAFDKSSKIDDLTAQPGWTAYKVYEGKESTLKMGTATYAGWLTTPLLNAPAGGNVTVVFEHIAYNGVPSTTMDVILLDENDNTLATQNIEITNNTYILNFAGITKNFKVKFAPAARIYIDNIAVYSEKFTGEQLGAGESIWDDAQKFNNLTATSRVFTGLANGRYAFRVQAGSDNGVSEWTKPAYVTLGSPSGIETILGKATAAPIYNISGRYCGTDIQQLPAGVYIQAGRKFIVK